MDFETFAKRLKQARQAKGLTQRQLAEKAGTTQNTISTYEKNGQKQFPSVTMAAKLADALNVSIDWLCGHDAGKGQIKDDMQIFVEKFVELVQRDVINVMPCDIPPEKYRYNWIIRNGKANFDIVNFDAFFKQLQLMPDQLKQIDDLKFSKDLEASFKRQVIEKTEEVGLCAFRDCEDVINKSVIRACVDCVKKPSKPSKPTQKGLKGAKNPPKTEGSA